MSHITLVIPGLLPVPAAITAADLPACPNLQRLLARADRKPLSIDVLGWLLAQLGCKTTPVPYAALGYLADSGEQQPHVLHADPVHLSAGREGVVLFDDHMLGLHLEEAQELAATVQPLLDEFNAELKVMQAGRWYLLCDAAVDINTYPLMEVIGRDVSDRLPFGDDQTRWRRLFNEIQMTLHEAPVNQARERRGQLPVNSVWFWGEGEAGPPTACDHDLCISDDASVVGLARQHGIVTYTLADAQHRPQEWLDRYRDILIHDHSARYFQAYQNAAAWLGYMARLEEVWIAPLMKAVNSGQVQHLRLVTGIDKYTYRRQHAWRFWRRSRPLA